MNTLVDIAIEDSRWDALDLQALCDEAARLVLRRLGKDPEDHEISLLACDDARIAELNGQFRAKATATNVLSWPTLDLSAEVDGDTPDHAGAVSELGDIAVAWETCAREAQDLNISMRNHVFHLIVHGILHLLGYDHIRDKDAALMESLEVAILADIGIADPYMLAMVPQPDNGL